MSFTEVQFHSAKCSRSYKSSFELELGMAQSTPSFLMSTPSKHATDIEKDGLQAPVRNDSGSDNLGTLHTRESSIIEDSGLSSILGNAISDEEVDKHRPKLRGAQLNACLAFVAGAGFTLFGYDQGVLSALLTAEKVSRVFCMILLFG